MRDGSHVSDLTETLKANAEGANLPRRKPTQWELSGGMNDVTVGGSGTGSVAQPEFDEAWYLGKYSQVQDLIIEGRFPSARRHYEGRGRQQGWLPRRPPGDDTRFAPPQREFVRQPSILRLL